MDRDGGANSLAQHLNELSDFLGEVMETRKKPARETLRAFGFGGDRWI